MLILSIINNSIIIHRIDSENEIFIQKRNEKLYNFLTNIKFYHVITTFKYNISYNIK